MHPLRIYLENVRAESEDRIEYKHRVHKLAAQVGIAPVMFNNIMNPNQKRTDLCPKKALKLESATAGEVPAHSVCGSIFYRVNEARSVVCLADELGY